MIPWVQYTCIDTTNISHRCSFSEVLERFDSCQPNVWNATVYRHFLLLKHYVNNVGYKQLYTEKPRTVNIHRKGLDSELHIRWTSHTPIQYRECTFKILLLRAYGVFLIQERYAHVTTNNLEAQNRLIPHYESYGIVTNYIPWAITQLRARKR